MKACDRNLQEVFFNPAAMSLKDGMHSPCKFIAYKTNRAFLWGCWLQLQQPMLTIESLK